MFSRLYRSMLVKLPYIERCETTLVPVSPSLSLLVATLGVAPGRERDGCLALAAELGRTVGDLDRLGSYLGPLEQSQLKPYDPLALAASGNPQCSVTDAELESFDRLFARSKRRLLTQSALAREDATAVVCDLASQAMSGLDFGGPNWSTIDGEAERRLVETVTAAEVASVLADALSNAPCLAWSSAVAVDGSLQHTLPTPAELQRAVALNL
jgi:hypothetical protein